MSIGSYISPRQIWAWTCYKRARQLVASGRQAAGHRWFARAARFGSADGQYWLGNNYSRGFGCIQSGSEALRWYRRAAEAGHTDAQFELGVILTSRRDQNWCAGPSARWAEQGGSVAMLIFPEGLSIEQDTVQAFTWLCKAAQAGKPEAQANVGWMLLRGSGCKIDRSEAYRWLTLAAEQRIGQAAFGLAEFYGDKGSPEYDEAETLRWLKKAADAGVISAAYRYGVALVAAAPPHSADLSEAESYLDLAARSNNADAAYALGMLLLSGDASSKNPDRAIDLLRSAAKLSHCAAAVKLGELYSRGELVKPDWREAAHWIKRAADQGHVGSQFQLGCFYARGEGLPKDLLNAARCFEQSAAQGHLIGALNAGILYEQGDGVSCDLPRSVDLLTKAANGGVPQAQLRLGMLFASGRLGKPSPKSARTYIEKAVEQGSPEAEFALAQFLIAEGVQSDQPRAKQLLRKAASNGHIIAADILLNNPNADAASEADRIEGFAALESAAQSGNTAAMRMLASAFLRIRNHHDNLQRAEFWLKRAMQAGDAAAAFDLGVFYCQRMSAPSDSVDGLRCYLQAAAHGHSTAQYNAGIMILNDAKSDDEVSKATELLRMAASQGFLPAERALEQFRRSQPGADPESLSGMIA